MSDCGCTSYRPVEGVGSAVLNFYEGALCVCGHVAPCHRIYGFGDRCNYGRPISATERKQRHDRRVASLLGRAGPQVSLDEEAADG